MARRKVSRGAPPQLVRSNGRKWAKHPTATGRKPKRLSVPEDDAESTLGTYFREMSAFDMMSPEQEAKQANRIAKMRRDMWLEILSYPPFIEGIVELARERLDRDELPDALLTDLVRHARAYRDRETRANRDAYEADRAATAEVVTFVDVDSVVSDQVLSDLERIESGIRTGFVIQVRPPRRDSQPYRDYVGRVRSTTLALRHAKNRFVKANLRLVVSIARRFNHGRLPLQDLIQEGNIGLMKAVDRFDCRKGFRFSTYGSWWIRHAISRAVADKGRAVRLPVHMLDAHHKVMKARRELETLHGREPTVEELASHTGLAATKIEGMDPQMLEQPLSLDRPLSDEDGRRAIDFLEDETSELPAQMMETDAMNRQVLEVITNLRPIEADILRKRFGLEDDNELTLKEIGEKYSLSRERIRQLQEQAIGKIRQELRRRDVM